MGEPDEKQDNTSAEQTDTSKEEPESFTREQMEEERRKANSDALAELGRVRKLNEGLIKSSQAIQGRLEKRDKEDDEREREKYQDQPDRLDAIGERIKRRDVESKLAKTEQELEDEKAKTAEAQEVADKSTKERNAREIATRLSVDFKPLVKYTDGSAEAMEDLAKSLPKKGDTQTLTPDSGKTTGGSRGIPTNKEQFEKWVDNVSQEDYEKLAPEINKMMKEGKIK